MSAIESTPKQHDFKNHASDPLWSTVMKLCVLPAGQEMNYNLSAYVSFFLLAMLNNKV